ncbi:ABC transporter ATP-binding protein [Brucella pituitosa]|uniref:ABC transporter ATP-binding protein n=1 Tax=Brucella pituitosa TaxID=571256 RepID=UPI002003A569|nr:ABC transporter ATP-binding protein [Brucella pituitosa]MCK4207665.1 ABC transporter ATP-binding protein [Brucella pituitosa]
MTAFDTTLSKANPLKAQPKISLRDIELKFTRPGGEAIDVLNHVSLDVAPGQFVAIVGPSGCGKSTLLRILSGLIVPNGGKALIDGRPINANRERIGFMFQRDTLLPWASVEENIRVGAELADPERRSLPERIEELIAFLRLTGFEKHLPHELSGGMRQRVALGRLMAYEPQIYLLDEPFGALDSQTKSAMGRELLKVWSLHHRSVLFVTHDIDEAVTLSDRVIVLSARPGTVKLDIPIELERPREPAVLRKTPRFQELIEQIWGALDHVEA